MHVTSSDVKLAAAQPTVVMDIPVTVNKSETVNKPMTVPDAQSKSVLRVQFEL